MYWRTTARALAHPIAYARMWYEMKTGLLGTVTRRHGRPRTAPAAGTAAVIVIDTIDARINRRIAAPILPEPREVSFGPPPATQPDRWDVTDRATRSAPAPSGCISEEGFAPAWRLPLAISHLTSGDFSVMKHRGWAHSGRASGANRFRGTDE